MSYEATTMSNTVLRLLLEGGLEDLERGKKGTLYTDNLSKRNRLKTTDFTKELYGIFLK